MARTLKYEQFVKDTFTKGYLLYDEIIKIAERDGKFELMLDLADQAAYSALDDHWDVLRYMALQRFRARLLERLGRLVDTKAVLDRALVEVDSYCKRCTVLDDNRFWFELARYRIFFSEIAKQQRHEDIAAVNKRAYSQILITYLNGMNEAEIREFLRYLPMSVKPRAIRLLLEKRFKPSLTSRRRCRVKRG